MEGNLRPRLWRILGWCLEKIYDLPRAELFALIALRDCGRSSLCESNRGNPARLLIFIQKNKNTKGTNAKRICNETRDELLVA